MGQQDKGTNFERYNPAREPSGSNRLIEFTLSLIGGIMITLGAMVETSFGFMGRPYGYGWMVGGNGGFLGGLMNGYYEGGFGPGMMNGFYGGYGYSNYSPMLIGFTIVGLTTGIIVLASALYIGIRRMSDTRVAGAIILVISLIGIVSVGGLFLIGGVLGIVGGVLALVTK